MKYNLTFFYNLMFSSLKVSDREIILDNSLANLLKLVKKNKIKVSICMTGYSLEIAKKIRPKIIKEMKSLIDKGYLELVGSSYSQIIQPLVPADVNKRNIELGFETYKKILGIVPKTATCNEGVFSFSGAKLLESYNYKNLLLEWNNVFQSNNNLDTSLSFNSQILKGTKINLIWYNSIIFQALQRYVRGDLDLKTYIEFIKNFQKKGYLCLYASDGEIFGYNPKRYADDITPRNSWKKIENLIKKFPLNSFIHTYESVNKEISKRISVTNANNPVLVKKQNKYNIYRWAITGRDDSRLNSTCYKIFYSIKNSNIEESNIFLELLKLWSSDYRTHIETNRWKLLSRKLSEFQKKLKIEEITNKSDYIYSLKGFKKLSNIRFVKMKSKNSKIIFDNKKGLTINKWLINNKNTICTIPFNKFDNINLGADFYSANSLIEPAGHKKITNLLPSETFIKKTKNENFLISKIKSDNYLFYKKYIFYKNKNCMDLNIKIETPKRSKEKIRLLSLTFDDLLFKKSSLFYSVNLGSDEFETFYLKDNFINQEINLNQNISAYKGFAASNGVLIIGDNKNKCEIKFDQSMSFLMSQIVYMPFKKKDNYFLRINFSAQEIDETFRLRNSKQEIANNFKFCWNSKKN